MRRMQRFVLAASLFASACGSTQPQHSTAPSPAHAQKYDPNEVVCVDEEFAPRGTAGQRCRRRGDVDADKARNRDAIEHATVTNRSK